MKERCSITCVSLFLLFMSCLSFEAYREQQIDEIIKTEGRKIKNPLGISEEPSYEARTGAKCQVQNFTSSAFGDQNRITFALSTLYSTHIQGKAVLFCFSSSRSYNLSSSTTSIVSVLSRTARSSQYRPVTTSYTSHFGHIWDFLGEDDYFAYSFTRSRYDDFFGARYQTPYIVNDAVYTGGPSDVSSLTGSRNCIAVEGVFQPRTEYEITLEVTNPTSGITSPCTSLTPSMPFGVTSFLLGEASISDTTKTRIVVRGDKYGSVCEARPGVSQILTCSATRVDANSFTIANDTCSRRKGVLDTRYPQCILCDDVVTFNGMSECVCDASKLTNLVGGQFCGERILPSDATVVSIESLGSRLCSLFSELKDMEAMPPSIDSLSVEQVSGISIRRYYVSLFLRLVAPLADYEFAKNVNASLWKAEVRDGRRLSDPTRQYGVQPTCVNCDEALPDLLGDIAFLSVQSFRFFGKVLSRLSTSCSTLYQPGSTSQLDPSPRGSPWA